MSENWERGRAIPNWKHMPTIHTPFKSFLPEAGKMLTYFEAIRNPKKHMVNTLTIGKTAILILPNKDSPPEPPWFCKANRNLPIVSAILTRRFSANQSNLKTFILHQENRNLLFYSNQDPLQLLLKLHQKISTIKTWLKNQIEQENHKQKSKIKNLQRTVEDPGFSFDSERKKVSSK